MLKLLIVQQIHKMKENMKNKKDYVAPKMKSVKLKRQGNLLCDSEENCGENAYVLPHDLNKIA